MYWLVPWSAIDAEPGTSKRIDTRFATKAHLKNLWLQKPLDVEIKDKNDIEVLKDALSGWAAKDATGCLFDSDVSITLTDGHKSITFCPNMEDEPVISVEDTDGRYLHLSNLQNKKLYRIFDKYGMDLPIAK